MESASKKICYILLLVWFWKKRHYYPPQTGKLIPIFEIVCFPLLGPPSCFQKTVINDYLFIYIYLNPCEGQQAIVALLLKIFSIYLFIVPLPNMTSAGMFLNNAIRIFCFAIERKIECRMKGTKKISSWRWSHKCDTIQHKIKYECCWYLEDR